MTVWRSKSLRAALFGFAALGVAACGPRIEVPLPNLDGVEQQIIDAVEAERAGVRAQPQSAEAWGALGDRYYAHEWFAEAAECYSRAEAFEPDEFRWPYLIGHSRFSDSKDAEAAAAFSRALELNPHYPPCYVVLGQVLTYLGRLDEARFHFRVASRMDQRSSHAEHGLGQIAIRLGDFESARVHLTEAVRRNPYHAEAHHALAQTYMALGDQAMAEHHAERTRELPKRTSKPDALAVPTVAPAGSVAHVLAGNESLAAGRLQRAASHFSEAIRVNPEFQPAYTGLGNALVRAGRFEEARGVLGEALRLKNSDVETLWYLERAMKGLGDEQAAKDYRRTGAEAARQLGSRSRPGASLDWQASDSTATTYGHGFSFGRACPRSDSVFPESPVVRKKAALPTSGDSTSSIHGSRSLQSRRASGFELGTCV